jgi:hypothetical protein
MSPVLKELLETCGLTANPCAASCVRRSRWPEMPLKSLAVVLFNVKSRDFSTSTSQIRAANDGTR